MKTTHIKNFNKFRQFLITNLIVFLVILLTGSMIHAKEKPLAVTEKNNQGETIIKVKNPEAYHWYLLYHVQANGSYHYVEAQASDGPDIEFSSKANMAGTYEVFEYASAPQTIPQIPGEEKKIKGYLSVPGKK